MDKVWFVFLFLPCVIFLNYFTPNKYRSVLICLSSIIFLAICDLFMLPLVSAFVLVDFILGIFMDKINSKVAQNIIMFLSVVVNLGVFVLSQYISVFPVILGVAVMSLVKVSYLADIRSGKSSAQKNLFSYLSAVLCFPCMHYGPILNVSSTNYMIKSGKLTLTGFGSGASLFIYGLFKKVIISDMLYSMIEKVYPSVNTVLGAWIWIVFSILAFYYLFLGYAQMAQGVCKMLGFKINQNFSFPFMSCTISDFFRRFNIGLTEFTRKYIYINLGGNRNGFLALVLAVVASSIFSTFWYGFSLNKLVAALFFAIGIILEKIFLNKPKPIFFKILYTFLVYAYLLIGFTLFFTNSATEATILVESAFAINNNLLFDTNILCCISEYLSILILSVLMLFNFPKLINRAIQKKKSVFLNILFVIFNLFVLFVCTAYIV